jgi:predicted nucleotidyltransferase
LRVLAEEGFSAVRGYHHYVAMAKKNFRSHLRGAEVRYKKYLYVLRPLLAARWIREGRGVPPMRFAALAQATVDDPLLIDEINRLLDKKMSAGEAATSPQWPAIHQFIESELAVATHHVMTPAPSIVAHSLDAFLYETVLRNERASGSGP